MMFNKEPGAELLSDRIESALRLAILVPAPFKVLLIELALRVEAIESAQAATRLDPVSGLALSEGTPWTKQR